MRNKVLVIGDITLDVISNTPRFPIESGKSVISETLLLEPGGNANTMIMASRLGASVDAVGYAGTDMQGDYSLGILEQEGVNTEFIERERTTTTVITLTDLKGNHAFHGKPGEGKPLNENILHQFRWTDYSSVYFSGYSINDPRTNAICRKATDFARANDCKVIIDVGPEFDKLKKAEKRYFMQNVDILLLTEDEIPFTSYEDIQSIMRANKHASIIEKRGKRGCVVYLPTGEKENIPAYDVAVVDTSGAGDSFAGGFIAALQAGLSVVESSLVANCVGQVKVQKVGCGREVPTKEEVRLFCSEFKILLPQGQKLFT